jgi:3-oxoacyl-[acyl-carrier-protein] synthase-1
MQVFIAGTGAVCAAGTGVDAGFAALRGGLDFLKPWSHADLRTTVPPLCAAVASDLELLAGREGLYRTLALALAAADEAMQPFTRSAAVRLGVVAATTVAGISQTEYAYKNYRTDKSTLPALAVESAVHEPAVLSAELCRRVGGCGFHTVSTACSSSLHAVGMAKRLIENDYYDACLAVGADALCITTVRGFGSLTLLDPAGCRPFDKNRAGISLGEGAGALLLVSPAAFRQCANKPSVTVSGWGASSDCFHMTAPHPEGIGARNAMQAALAEAGISPAEIDGIVAHGTGTPDNDKAEISAIKALFARIPPFCSMKRTFGHTLAASGILETVIAVKMIQTAFMPSTAGFSEFDPQIGIAPAPAAEM